MTREEAIEWFKNSAFYHKDHEPFNMAISALEQEPCDDAISRVLERMWNCRGKNTTSIDKVKMEQIIREELPSVQPSRKGHWIIKDRYYHDTVTAECSECGREVEIPTCMSELMYKGCPYCLVEMESTDADSN